LRDSPVTCAGYTLGMETVTGGSYPANSYHTLRSREAFMRLLQHNKQPLLWASRRLCRGQEEKAEDLVQETLVRAYEAFLKGRYQEEANGNAWLLRILTNIAINDYHRRKLELRIGLELLASAGEVLSVQRQAVGIPGASLLAATLDEELELALAALPEKGRRCVTLVDLEGLEYDEAAALLGIPVGTVRSRLFRARRQLYSQLQAYGKKRQLV